MAGERSQPKTGDSPKRNAGRNELCEWMRGDSARPTACSGSPEGGPTPNSSGVPGWIRRCLPARSKSSSRLPAWRFHCVKTRPPHRSSARTTLPACRKQSPSTRLSESFRASRWTTRRTGNASTSRYAGRGSSQSTASGGSKPFWTGCRSMIRQVSLLICTTWIGGRFTGSKSSAGRPLLSTAEVHRRACSTFSLRTAETRPFREMHPQATDRSGSGKRWRSSGRPSIR
jgi:hypothetical protein